MPKRRYDTYGFRSLNLNAAATYVEAALKIQLRERDSLYRGIYYCGGNTGDEYVLITNDENARWHDSFPDYSVFLNVSELPDMDTIRDRLTTGQLEPILLRSVVKDMPDDDDDTHDDDTHDDDTHEDRSDGGPTTGNND